MRVDLRAWTLIAGFVTTISAQSPLEAVQFHPGYRTYFGLEFDVVRGEVLAFGGIDAPDSSMWGWNGARWREQRAVSPGPLGRPLVATTGDVGSARIFVYGGFVGSTPSTELWQWNGTAWTLLASGGPPARMRTALAFDPLTQSLYLYGGVTVNNFPLGDLWKWNGTTWTQIPVGAPAPAARESHAMVWDPTLGSGGGLLIFGGTSYYTGSLNDTWRWTAAGGFVPYAGASPLPQYDHAMCRDAARNRILLFAHDYAARVSQTWEWTGSAWQQRQPLTVPEYRRQARLAYDPTRQRVVLYGGGESPSPETIYSVYEWDGVDWALRSTELGGKSEVVGAYDEARGIHVLFALRYIGPLSPITSTTWQWDGGTLAQLGIAGPSARGGALLWYDPVRQRTMLQGGRSLTPVAYLNDTWDFDGVAWRQLAPPSQPPGRVGGALAYDPVRQRAVLFGGTDNTDRQDTWEWTGANWLLQTPAQSPPPRSGACLGYDPITRRLILFGGYQWPAVLYVDDTWAWDGTSWQQLQPSTRPPARASARMVHDRDRNRLVMFGGGSQTAGLQHEIWEWTGTDWVAAGQLPAGSGWMVTFDSRRGRTLHVQNVGLRYELARPWSSVGPANAAGDPLLTCQSRPAVGGSVHLAVTSTQPGAMAALLSVGTPSLPFGIPGFPFCSPTVVYLPGQIIDVPLASGGVLLSVPASPQLAFLALTAQAAQLRGTCVELSNALCIRVQP
jgi:hypothetical protein